MLERYKRQLDLVDYDKLDFDIAVLGSGGIGSWATLLLAKMGCQNISIVDDDEVEEHNVASQFYKTDQLGQPKTKALAENVMEQTGTEVLEYPISLENEAITDNSLVVIATDSMEARRNINNKIKNLDVYVIDARMGGLQLELYNCHASQYYKTLVEDKDITPEPCTGKSISFNCATIGSFIAHYVKLYSEDRLEQNTKGMILMFGDLITILRN